jgi:transglutaminase-like putative cysteine protease
MALARLQSKTLSRAANSGQLLAIPDGPEGVRVTLEIMARLAREASLEPAIQGLAIELTQGVRNEDFYGEIAALHAFVRDEIRYVQDVNGVETLRPPLDTLALGAGDCDDKSVLLAALLESIGHPARYTAVAFEPDLFEHVYVESRFDWRGRKWLPLETTKEVPPGWEPEGIVGRMCRRVRS